MRSDSRTDHDHDPSDEPVQPAAYPVFTGDREGEIPTQRHGEHPFGTPPGGYEAPPEPVDEFDRPADADHTGTGTDDADDHGRHTFADADGRTDRDDHDGTDPDDVAVGRAAVPENSPVLDPDERAAVASTAPTGEDFDRAHTVATDPVQRDDLDVRPTVLHGTGTDDHRDGQADALPDLDTSAGHSAADTGGFHDPETDRPSTVDDTGTDRPTGYHENSDPADTGGFHDPETDRPSTVDDTGHHDSATAVEETAADEPRHHDEEEPVAFPVPATTDRTDEETPAGEADTDGTPVAEELKPGDAEIAPVPTFWAAADTDGYRDRWREAQFRFVDDPKEAADEIRGIVSEAADAVANALTEQRRDLDAWSGEGDGPRDTEQLRVVIQRYRTFFDRLLGL